jgi:3-hydroxymyristoyl/3-hydroxydecanoyl-(acyl carrier protein) dehydratase
MSLHRFSAFSFVDRITSIGSSGQIKGSFLIPAHLEFFPQSLVAEAIGQLAAWYAMSSLNFERRPVAALAGATKYHSEARPGERLNLEAIIESCDNESVSYSGVASVGERLVLELVDCSGAMLPQQEFDDPETIGQQFKLLETTGAKENRLAQAPCILPTDLKSDALGTLEGSLIIPSQADFFADHFPNKPVFPATLLMHALSSMVIEQINCSPLPNQPTNQPNQPQLAISSMARVKVRSWIAPGDQVKLRAEGLTPEIGPKQVKLSAHVGTKLVASALLSLVVAPSPQEA